MGIALLVKFLSIIAYDTTSWYIFAFWPFIYWTNFVIFLWIVVTSKTTKVFKIRHLLTVEQRLQSLYGSRFEAHIYLANLVSFDYELGIFVQNAQEGHFVETDIVQHKASS